MRRTHAGLLVLLFFAYGSFYLCRANVDAANPLLIRDGGFTKADLGQLSTIAMYAYAVGKFLMGGLGDALGGRRILAVAVCGSVVFSLGFGMSHTFLAMIVFAAANRFFQSGGWSGVVHVVSRWFEPRVHGRVMGLLSTSYELGNAAALLLSGVVVRWGWRALFVVNPLLLALIGGTMVALLPAAPPGEAAKEESIPLGTLLRSLLVSGAMWTALALSALLTFIRIGFLTWTPTYLYELSRALGHEEVSGAIFKSAVFPLAGVVAALVVGRLSDRLGPGRRAPIMAASLAVVVVLVLVLGHSKIREPLAAAAVIAGVGLFVLGPYSLMAGAIALDVAGKRGTATATGMIDGAGYLVGSAAPLVLGKIADKAGWPAVFDILAVVALLAAAISGAWSLVVFRRRA
jgi:MFS transporter, OPA family, glycerol-3-phosphate transporter